MASVTGLARDPMPNDPPQSPGPTPTLPIRPTRRTPAFGRRLGGSGALEPPSEVAANDREAGSTAFRAEVAPLLAVLGYHLADPAAAPPLPFGERRKAPRTLDRLAELEAQIARHGDPSGLRHRLRRLLLAELELLGVVGRRREDRPLADAAARALRG